jgi:hypothetical protein
MLLQYISAEFDRSVESTYGYRPSSSASALQNRLLNLGQLVDGYFCTSWIPFIVLSTAIFWNKSGAVAAVREVIIRLNWVIL